MGDKLAFEGLISGKKFNKEGKILKEYNGKKEGIIDIEDIEENKICIDANMMILAILKPDFKNLLIENKGDDLLFTTHLFKKESLNNLMRIKKINRKEAEKEFEMFEKEIGLRYLKFKEEYQKNKG